MTAKKVLIVIGVILIGISAFWNHPRCNFFNLGWAFVLTGALVITE